MRQTAVASEPYREPSLKKQLLLTDYARGQISIEDLVNQMSEIQPPKYPTTTRRRVGLFFATVLAALVVPPWHRRED